MGKLFVFPLSALPSPLPLGGLLLSLLVIVMVLAVSTVRLEVSLFWSY